MAETGNSLSEAGESAAAASTGANDLPAADGNIEKAAQSPTSPIDETVKPSTDSSAILFAAGEPLNVPKVIPDAAAVCNDVVVPATPPATPTSGNDQHISLPSIPDPIIIHSTVSIIPSPDLINNSTLSASASPTDADIIQNPSPTSVSTDSTLKESPILTDASASVATTPVLSSSLPANPDQEVTSPSGTATTLVASIPAFVTPSVPIASTPQVAPLVPAVPILPEIACSIGSLPVANGNIPIIPTPSENLDADSSDNDEWNRRESELMFAVSDLEQTKKQVASDAIKLKIKAKDDEIELLKARVKTLETELTAALTRPGARNHELVETIKQQHEELLSRARGMLFDKTKIVKNQELQIAALTAQVASLKDVNSITKDLLEIRNSEIKHLEERMESMEGRFKAEKERHMLVLKRAETGQSINNDLRTEYETQLKLFKELREKYDQRVQALVAENKRLAEASGAPAPSPST